MPRGRPGRRHDDPGATEIWTTYNILADIAARQRHTAAALRYRAEERRTYAAAPIARGALRRHGPLIVSLLAALRHRSERPVLEQPLAEAAGPDSASFVGALRTLLDGKHVEDALYEPLNREESLIVMTILRCLADPKTEQALFREQP